MIIGQIATPSNIWAHIQRTLTNPSAPLDLNNMLTGISATATGRAANLDYLDAAISSRPTTSEIWSYTTRKITAAPFVIPMFLVPTNILTRGLGGNYKMLPIADTSTLLATTIDSSIGTETTETERLNYVYLTPILCKGRLKSYVISVYNCHAYIDTISGTYRYRMYVQPVVVDYTGTTSNLESERLIFEYSHAAVGSAGWNDYTVNAVLRVANLDLSFDGILGLRLRTTSWNTGGGNSGHGFYYINDNDEWSVLLNVEVES